MKYHILKMFFLLFKIMSKAMTDCGVYDQNDQQSYKKFLQKYDRNKYKTTKSVMVLSLFYEFSSS